MRKVEVFTGDAGRKRKSECRCVVSYRIALTSKLFCEEILAAAESV